MAEIKLIYENSDFVALNKPSATLVYLPQSARIVKKSGFQSQPETVADWVRAHYPESSAVGDNPGERPGMAHRLDKDTSGVLLVARTQKGFQRLKTFFKEGKIEKRYLALVWGKVERNGTVNKPIGLVGGTVKRGTRGKRIKMAKEAITEYAPLRAFEKNGIWFTLMRVMPKTGRTHQIRVHLAHIGHAVVGDPLYAKKENPWGLTRQFLHAESIEFTRENGKRIRIEAALPEELMRIAEEGKNR